MGKGDRKAKSKPRQDAIVPLAAIKPKPRQPRFRGKFAAEPKDDTMTALIARCVRVGKTPDKAGRAAVKAPWYGEPIGMCIAHRHEQQDTVAALWSVWMGLCTAQRAYRARILNSTGEPQGAAIQVLPERIESSDHHTIDTRTAEQKDKDAIRAYMRWRGYLGQMDKDQASQLLGVENGTAGILWRNQQPTLRGMRAARALELLAQVVDRNQKRQGL